MQTIINLIAITLGSVLALTAAALGAIFGKLKQLIELLK